MSRKRYHYHTRALRTAIVARPTGLGPDGSIIFRMVYHSMLVIYPVVVIVARRVIVAQRRIVKRLSRLDQWPVSLYLTDHIYF
jgi:hypothetical protein